MNMGSTAGIIVGILAGLLAVGILIFCCCRKKGNKDKYAEGYVLCVLYVSATVNTTIISVLIVSI